MKSKTTLTTILLGLLATAGQAGEFSAAAAQGVLKTPLPAAGGHRQLADALRPSRQNIAPVVKPNSLPRLSAPSQPSRFVDAKRALNVNPGGRDKPGLAIPRFSRNAIPGFDAGLANSLRAGAEIANGLKDAGQLRGRAFGTDLPRELPGFTRTGGAKRPADPFAENNFTPRTPTAPGHISRNLGGNGLTDIRSSATNGQKGSGHGSRPMSSFGRGLSASGPRVGRVFYGNDGNNRSSSSDSGVGNGGMHTTTEHRDGRGHTVGYTDSWSTADEAGSRHTTDTYGANGEFTGSETVFEFLDGSIQSKSVAQDGHVVVTTDDGRGNISQYESAGSGAPGTRTVDRNPAEGASLGGPVGPGAAAITGLAPLDLLRQREEGAATGGTNTMTHGRIRANHVNPGSGNDMVPFAGAKRNNIGSQIGGLAGPTTGGSGGGSPLPD